MGKKAIDKDYLLNQFENYEEDIISENYVDIPTMSAFVNSVETSLNRKLEGVTVNDNPVTINNKVANITINEATTENAGLLSAEDKTKLDNIDSSGSTVSYTPEIIEGTKIGTLTVNGSPIEVYVPEDENTTYNNATTTADGLMSSSDKTKLDGIAASADAVSFTQTQASGTKIGTILINSDSTDLYAPNPTTEADIAEMGFTKNTGTVTGIVMNGASKGSSGVVDLGTVITDVSGKQNSSTAVKYGGSAAVGSTTKGVYVDAAGNATAMTYELNKTVPADAKFTDTTYEVLEADKTDETSGSLVTPAEKYDWNGKLDAVSGGTGINVTTGAWDGERIVKANLKSMTASTLEAASKGSTTNREYAVGVDINGHLSVNVPWTDNNTEYTAATAAPGNVASSSAVGTSTNYARQDHTHGITVGTGDSNGQVKVAGINASVKGLGSAAYTNSNAYIAASAKGAALGVAELDSSGKVPSSQLPAFVDDVLEYTAKASFPATGETGKIYVDTTTNLTYRWGGTAYVEISPSLALGETSSTAYRGDRGKTAYDHASAKGSAFSSGLYKITTNAEGHVTAASAVAKSDITALGIPGSNTNTTYTLTQDTTDGHKFTFAGSDGTSVTITIPDNNTTYTLSSLGIGNVKNYDQSKAIKSITRSGTTFTYTCLDNTTGTFTQQDNNTWTAMVGATSSANGTAGYVPTPPKDGYNTKYLRADGTWSVPAYPTVNNATLTIQKNGTNVQTFTANQSSNATANITVPTKVSELTNDSGFTTNTGTVTSVKVGSTSYNPSSGVVSLPAYPTDTDAKTSSADSSSKLFLVGATSQSSSGQTTYSDDQVYTTSGTLTSNKLSTKALIALTGSGTAGADKGSGVSPRYIPTLWTFNAGVTVANGEIYLIKIPTAGGTYGVWLSLNNGTNYYPVAVSSGAGRFTTHYAANTVIAVTYESAGTCSCYAKAGADAVATVTGIFRVLNDYDANTTYSAMSSSELTTGTATTSRTVRADYLKTGINSLIDTKINALDVTGASGIAASKTISAWSETDGKISISTQNISITKSQVSDFPTSMTPTSHTHGNIQNGGTLQTNDITIASGDKLVVTDSSDSSKVARTSISFDGSTATKALTQKGTWESFTNNAGTITGIKMNGASKGTSGVVDLGTVITAHQDISGKADKSATVSTVAWDSTNKKITKTINGTTSDVVTAATILGNLTKAQVTTALGYTPPTTDTNNRKSFYGTCSTAAATKDKVVTLAESAGWPGLVAGVIVGVKFTNTNSYSNATSSPITLNVNSTGAKNIYYANTHSGAGNTGTNTTAYGRANYINYYMYDGTYWVWLSSSTDNNTDVRPSAYCDTAAGTAAKVASCSGYKLRKGNLIHLILVNTNTYAGTITLNINGTGAKVICIDDSATSQYNYDLQAGSYLVYYDGTYYHFRNDGGFYSGTHISIVDDSKGGGVKSTELDTRVTGEILAALNTCSVYDKNFYQISTMYTGTEPDRNYIGFKASNYDSNWNYLENWMSLSVDRNGNQTYGLANPSAFRDTIGLFGQNGHSYNTYTATNFNAGGNTKAQGTKIKLPAHTGTWLIIGQCIIVGCTQNFRQGITLVSSNSSNSPSNNSYNQWAYILIDKTRTDGSSQYYNVTSLEYVTDEDIWVHLMVYDANVTRSSVVGFIKAIPIGVTLKS